jgi:hypothetical protein
VFGCYQQGPSAVDDQFRQRRPCPGLKSVPGRRRGGARRWCENTNDSSLSFSLPVNVCPEPVLANRRRFPSKKRRSKFLGSDKQTGEGADPKRVAAVPADPGNVTVFRRDPADGSLTPTGAQWTAPHVMSAQAAV